MCIRDRGKDNAREYLKDNPEISSEIESLIRDQSKISEANEELPEIEDMAEEDSQTDK